MVFEDKTHKTSETPQSAVDRPVWSAADLQAWRWKKRKPSFQPPGALIICMQPELVRLVRRHYALQPVEGLFGDCFLMRKFDKRLGLVTGFGIGAPSMAILVEEYAALGVQTFLSIGIAGALQMDLSAGDIVACQSAIQGDGTSNHYLNNSTRVEADPALFQGLCQVLDSHHILAVSGVSWTTDAPFRETRKAAQKHKDEGVLTVEMEAAALYAAAQCLGVQAAAVFAVGDVLLPDSWVPPSKPADLLKRLENVLMAVIPWMSGAQR